MLFKLSVWSYRIVYIAAMFRIKVTEVGHCLERYKCQIGNYGANGKTFGSFEWLPYHEINNY